MPWNRSPGYSLPSTSITLPGARNWWHSALTLGRPILTLRKLSFTVTFIIQPSRFALSYLLVYLVPTLSVSSPYSFCFFIPLFRSLHSTLSVSSPYSFGYHYPTLSVCFGVLPDLPVPDAVFPSSGETELLSFISLFSRSNQKGAPREMASDVSSQPTALRASRS